MNVIKFFLVICNLILALASVAGINQKLNNEGCISKGEFVGCAIVTLTYIVNVIFIWR